LYKYKHPRPAVAVDIVLFRIIDSTPQVLLILRDRDPFKDCYALPGGFVEEEESLEDAAQRELQEETGVSQSDLIQIHTFSQPDRDPRGRVISTAFGAVIKKETQIQLKAGSDAADAAWIDLEKLPDLAFDHQSIIQWAAARLNVQK